MGDSRYAHWYFSDPRGSTVAKTKPTSKKNVNPGFKGAGGPPPIKGAPRGSAPGGQKSIKPKAK
jgi:hypothetical protein